MTQALRSYQCQMLCYNLNIKSRREHFNSWVAVVVVKSLGCLVSFLLLLNLFVYMVVMMKYIHGALRYVGQPDVSINNFSKLAAWDTTRCRWRKLASLKSLVDEKSYGSHTGMIFMNCVFIFKILYLIKRHGDEERKGMICIEGHKCNGP